MDAMEFMYDGIAMLNEDSRVEKNCSVYGPNVMLVVYDPANGLQVCQKEIEDS